MRADAITKDEALRASRPRSQLWGTLRMTMRGDLLLVPATGRAAILPFFSSVAVVDGLLAAERVCFDLATLCDQLGVALPAGRDALPAFRAAAPPPPAL